LGDNFGLDVHTLLVGSMSILVGVQSLTFGLLARSYAKRIGMIPRSSRYDKWLADLKLEHLLGISGLLLAVGIGFVLWAVHTWSGTGFGALDYQATMRVLIVAVTCCVGGLQIGFSAFLLGVMQIRHRF
jgi:hypothetical protein